MRVVACAKGGFGDGRFAFQPQNRDGDVAKGRHDPWWVSRPDLASVLSPGHVPEPVVAVLNFPVAPESRNNEFWMPLRRRQVREDDADGLG